MELIEIHHKLYAEKDVVQAIRRSGRGAARPQARTARVILMWDVLSLLAAGVVILVVLRILDWYDERRH